MARDLDYLIASSKDVNTRYFGGKINAAIVMGITEASTTNDSYISDYQLNEDSGERDVYDEGLDLAGANQFLQAVNKLMPLCLKGHEDSNTIANLCIQKISSIDEAKASELSAQKNRVIHSHQNVEPSCATKDPEASWSITLHTALFENTFSIKTPKFVIQYLLYHEMLHVLLDTPVDDPHPEYLMKLDRTFTERDKAHTWLVKHGYTTP